MLLLAPRLLLRDFGAGGVASSTASDVGKPAGAGDVAGAFRPPFNFAVTVGAGATGPAAAGALSEFS